MLPTAGAVYPHALSISDVISVVEVLPFVPVMPIHGAGEPACAGHSHAPGELHLGDHLNAAALRLHNERRARVEHRRRTYQIDLIPVNVVEGMQVGASSFSSTPITVAPASRRIFAMLRPEMPRPATTRICPPR
jgi:hypothetical protein